MEVMAIAKKNKILNIKRGDYVVKQDKNFKYLGTKLKQNGSIECELHGRIDSAIKAYGNWESVFREKGSIKDYQNSANNSAKLRIPQQSCNNCKFSLSYRHIEDTIRSFSGKDGCSTETWIDDFELELGLKEKLAKKMNSAELHQMLFQRNRHKNETLESVNGIPDHSNNKILLYEATSLKELKKKLEMIQFVKNTTEMAGRYWPFNLLRYPEATIVLMNLR
ncbi:hypothetical protein ILUMI_21684 [Ignelater luminosus]|uniref:Uncharacterized protein n=1 Tax=Ignelater luminosus TaxID=2038154 RepID=A0A8K0G3M3_IGNLU|nr:hypothetical protein ILUMI_21684 [Ignelater luminosus]